jgi:branched-chain amino acid transport system substrate-binding protein
VAGELLASYVQGAQVWVRYTNDRGGVNGHRVRLVVGDDGGDPARHLALLQQFKDREHVLAFIAKPEPFTGPAVNDWHRKNRMPVIGPDPSADYAYTNPMYFVTASTGKAQYGGALSSLAKVAVPRGKTRLGIIRCAEAQACGDMDRVWTERAKALGFDVVYRAQVSLAQPDFTAECLGAQNAGAQVIGAAIDMNSTGRFNASCRRQSYEPETGSLAGSLGPTGRTLPSLDGSVWGATTWAWPAADNPARREFHEAIAKYRPGNEVLPLHALGWLNGVVFGEATRDLPEPPTTDAILDGLYRIKDNDFGGLTYPLTYRRDAPVPQRTCGTTVVIRNGQYTMPFGADLTCSD